MTKTIKKIVRLVRKIVATYDYVDEDGTLLYQSVRYDPKDFRQRQPNGKDKWIWNLKGIQKRVLYKLRELMAAALTTIIFVVEGEKDVEALEKIGLIATTNVGGAGKWKEEYVPYFKERHVVTLPDNDDPGCKHAEKVAISLHGMAASIKILALPDLPLKGDVSDWIQAGGTAEKLMKLVEATPEWKPEEKANKKSSAEKKQAKVPKDKPSYIATFEGLVDLALDKGQIAFLVKSDGMLVSRRDITINGKKYTPPPLEQIPWLLVRADKVIEHYANWEADVAKANRQLYDDLVTHHAGISELPDDRYYHLLAAFDFHTYLQEAAEYTPILCLFAVAERGKTRTIKGVAHVCFRGVRLVSLREAYIFRLAENLRASLFFDLMDVWQEAKRNNCEDILLNRFEKGSKVPRVLWPEKGAFRDTHYYEVYGPTGMGTNKSLHHILDTRALTIIMRESTKSFSNEVREGDARPLRERLTAFRAYYVGKDLPTVEKPVEGRLGDITRPLRQIVHVVRPEQEKLLIELCREFKTGSIQEKAETLEGQIIKIIVESEQLVVGSILPIKAITETYNDGKKERFHLTPQRVGQIVKALGFYEGTHRPRMSDGSAALPWNEALVNRLAESYGLQSSETSETSESKGKETVNVDITGLSDVSDDDEGNHLIEDVTSIFPETQQQLSSDKQPNTPCRICQGILWWQHEDDRWLCGNCHPNSLRGGDAP